MPLNNAHWTLTYYRQRMSVQEWKQILLNDEDHVIFNGHLCRLLAKRIGYGLVEVYKDIKLEDDHA